MLFYFVPLFYQKYLQNAFQTSFLLGSTPHFVEVSFRFLLTTLYFDSVFQRFDSKSDNLYVCVFLLNAEGPPNIYLLKCGKARNHIRNAKCYNKTIAVFLPSKRHITPTVKEPSCIINPFLHYQSYSIIIYTLI